MEFGDLRHLDFSPSSRLPEKVAGAASFYIAQDTATDFRTNLVSHNALTRYEQLNTTLPTLPLQGTMEGYVFLVEDYDVRPQIIRAMGGIACIIDETLSPPLTSEHDTPLHYLMYVHDQTPKSRLQTVTSSLLSRMGRDQEKPVLVRMQPDCNHVR